MQMKNSRVQNSILLILVFLCILSCKKQEQGFDPAWIEHLIFLKQEKNYELPIDLNLRIHQQVKANQYQRNSSNLRNVSVLGPPDIGGRTRAFLIDQSNSSRFICGGISGGLWESMDKGLNWNSISQHDENFPITSIDQNPFDDQVMYYTTGETFGNTALLNGLGLFKSVDGGQTFSLLPSTTNNNFFKTWRVVCSKMDSNTVYVASQTGLHVSEDGGETFTEIYDSGVTDIEVFEDGSLIIGVRARGIYLSEGKSSNYSWTKRNPVDASGFNRVELAYGKNNPNTIYSVIGDASGLKIQGIYRSDDKGFNWTKVNRPDDFGITSNQLIYCLALAVHPNNPDFVTCGTVRKSYSLDGGQTWNTWASGHVDVHLIYFDPDDPNIVYDGSDGGIHSYEFRDNEIKYKQKLNKGLNITQYYAGAYFPEGERTLGGTQDNGTQLATEDPNNYNTVRGADGGYCTVNPSNTEIAYASTQNGIFYRTENLSASFPPPTWTSLSSNLAAALGEGVNFITPVEMSPLNSDQLFYFSKKRVWMTEDRGENWRAIMNDNPGVYTSALLSKNGKQVGFFSGQSGVFLRIDDVEASQAGGEIDLHASLPSEIEFAFLKSIAVNPINENELFIGISSYADQARVWKVSDIFSSNPIWTAINGDLPIGLPVNSIAVHSEDDQVLIVGTDHGVFTSRNQGLNWVLVSDIPSAPVFDIKHRASDNRSFIFTHGRGVWAGVLLDREATSTTDYKLENLLLFPNPSEGQLSISWESQWRVSELRILSTRGQILFQSKIEEIQISKDFTHLKSGIYFVQLLSGGKVIGVEPWLKI